MCVEVEDVECVTTAARYCVCYPHQNTFRTYSKRLWIQYVPFFVMLLDIFTSGKCHQNFRFATSYPGIKYFAKMCTMWQPCIVRYQRGFPGFQDSMWGIAFECEIHKSNVPKTKNPEAPFTTREHVVLSHFEQEIQTCNLSFLFRIYWNSTFTEERCEILFYEKNRNYTENAIKTYNSAVSILKCVITNLYLVDREGKKAENTSRSYK